MRTLLYVVVTWTQIHQVAAAHSTLLVMTLPKITKSTASMYALVRALEQISSACICDACDVILLASMGAAGWGLLLLSAFEALERPMNLSTFSRRVG